MKKSRTTTSSQYDVCLSFAGEDRSYVQRVAEELSSLGIRTFYDEYERVELWGKDLYSHLDYVYRQATRYCVIFVSKHYARKLWTNHERRSAQARAFSASREYILPARFDATEIPGLQSTVGYVDLRQVPPDKLGPRQRINFFPPVPDRLFTSLEARSKRDKEQIAGIANSFFQALQRMSKDEQTALFAVFVHGCVADLPKNIHINLDLLRRITGFPPAKAMNLLAGLRSLGVYCRLRDEHGAHGEELKKDGVAVITFAALTADVVPTEDQTGVVAAIVKVAVDGFCEDCAERMFMARDFSQLASVMAENEKHSISRASRRVPWAGSLR